MGMTKVICGDCLEIMPNLPEGIVDMVLCDLPYGTTSLKWDSVIPLDKLWQEYERLVKPNGAIVLTASQPFTSTLVNSKANWFKYELIWVKTMPTGAAQHEYMPMKYHENILVFVKEGKPTFNKKLTPRSMAGSVRAKSPISGSFHKSNHVNMGYQEAKQYDPNRVNPKSVLEFASVSNGGGGKLHPTQKPVSLFSYLIETYSNPGDVILDNAAGSRTTGVAARLLNRDFILIEKEEKYVEIINSRLAQGVLL